LIKYNLFKETALKYRKEVKPIIVMLALFVYITLIANDKIRLQKKLVLNAEIWSPNCKHHF